jgi:hypothetical protein
MSASQDSFLARVAHKLAQEGLPGAAAAASRRARHWVGRRSPVPWAYFGALSRRLGQALPIPQPSVLVVSLPRSGSSWVGHTLGLAADAAYLREPLDQLYLSQGGPSAVHNFEPSTPPPTYRQAAALAFAGVPAFPSHLRIVADRGQWGLAGRRRRRVVVKMVNPYAVRWLLKTYRLRLIYLVRHPAAVALSFRRLGWWSPEPDHFRSLGRDFNNAHRAVMDAAADGAATRVVAYEALCRDPLNHFRALFEFSGLTWDERVDAQIERDTSGSDDGDPYSVSRHSATQADQWRRSIRPAELADLQAGYCYAPLPWYQAPEDWSLNGELASG